MSSMMRQYLYLDFGGKMNVLIILLEISVNYVRSDNTEDAANFECADKYVIRGQYKFEHSRVVTLFVVIFFFAF